LPHSDILLFRPHSIGLAPPRVYALLGAVVVQQYQSALGLDVTKSHFAHQNSAAQRPYIPVSDAML